VSGVFRDPNDGRYRYYSYNDYEERRLRDWDDHYGYSRPRPWSDPHAVGAAPPHPFVFAPSHEPDPPRVLSPSEQSVVDNLRLKKLVEDANAHPAASFDDLLKSANIQVPSPPPTLFTTENVPLDQLISSANAAPVATVPQLASWQGLPLPSTATAVPFRDMAAGLPSVPDPLPAKVGDHPEFDALFNQLAAEGKSITYQRGDDLFLTPQV
jgi:hypothetical protein